MRKKEEYKAYTDAPFMPGDEDIFDTHGIVPFREIELVKYELDSDIITVDFCGGQYNIPMEKLYRNSRPSKGPKRKKVFKTILRKIANRKERKSVIGVS